MSVSCSIILSSLTNVSFQTEPKDFSLSASFSFEGFEGTWEKVLHIYQTKNQAIEQSNINKIKLQMDHQDCFLLPLSFAFTQYLTAHFFFSLNKQPKSAVKLMALSHVIEMTQFINVSYLRRPALKRLHVKKNAFLSVLLLA